jgi:hypothetical protein
MNQFISRIRTPVKREKAENFLLLTLLSFGLSVGLTRLFLELTGYPQLGNSELHVAHVLWGGLFLFAASLLPLIFANRWVYTWGAIFAGLGVGLFIDEVGKFITQANDYFYPPAAPIIYAFFLVTVMVYLQVRRPTTRDPRAELYRAFDSMEEILDHDLDRYERAQLETRLRFVTEKATSPNLVRLAEGLLEYIGSESLDLTPKLPSFWEKQLFLLRQFEARWISQTRVKALITGSLGALAIVALIKLSQLIAAALNPARLQEMAAEMVALGRVASASGLTWFSARLALEGVVGIILLIAAILLLLGRDQLGAAIGTIGLLLSLTTVNLLVFYFDQFSTILTASIQFLVLIGVLYYRRRFL